MGDNELKKALTYAVLAGTSGWSLMKCTDLKYARVAFGLYLANGIVGVVDYVIPKKNQHVRRLLNDISRCSRPFYLPLITAEAMVYAALDEKCRAYSHLILPAGYLVLTEFYKKRVNKDYLNIIFICSSINIFLSGSSLRDLYGEICALLGLATFLGPDYNSMEYHLLIGATNIAAAEFLKPFF